MKAMRKSLTITFVVVAIFALSAGCLPQPAATNPTQAPDQAQDTPAMPDETGFTFPTQPVTIEIWWHEYAPFTAYMNVLIERYQTLHPNVKINPTVASSKDMPQKLSAALATGTAPHIMDQDASYYVMYYNSGVLEPLDLQVFGVKSYDELLAHYTDGGLDAATFDGKIYALPYQGNSMSLFINNRLFREAGLDPVADAPKTWQDVMALGEKLRIIENGITVQKAFDFPYHAQRWQLQDFQPIVEQFGGQILSDDGKTAYLNSEAAVNALTLWRDVTLAAGDPKNTLNTPSNPNQDFIDGRLAMWITGPWATPQIRASGVGDDFTVVSLPQMNPADPHTMVYGWMWGVTQSKPSIEKQVAWDFIRFMLEKPEEWLDQCGFVQPVRGVEQTEVARDFPFFDVHMRDVSTASWYVISPHTNEIALAVGRAIDKVVFDGADPKTVLDEAQAEVEKLLKP